jgi:hypothetical protein
MSLRALFAIVSVTTIGCAGSTAQRMPSETSTPSAPCSDAEAREFDFWIGEWDVVSRSRDLQKEQVPTFDEAGTLKAKVFPVNDGCAIVELTEGETSSGHVYGFSVRSFDPNKERWVYVLNWPSKNRAVFSVEEGTFHHGRIEAFSKVTRDRSLNRSLFSDITGSSYRWDAAVTRDSAVSWSTYWIMEGERRGPFESPIFNGPAAPPPLRPTCTLGEMSRFDFLVGSWEGDLEEEPDSRVRLDVYPILNGCAHMELLEIERAGRRLKRFAVRAYDTEIGRWVQFSTDNVDPRFKRLEGGMDQHGGVLHTSGEATQRRRETWSIVSGSSVYWIHSESSDRGMHWTDTFRASLNRKK